MAKKYKSYQKARHVISKMIKLQFVIGFAIMILTHQNQIAFTLKKQINKYTYASICAPSFSCLDASLYVSLEIQAHFTPGKVVRFVPFK